MPFPQSLEAVDYVCGALYKWLMGPYSMAFLFAAPQHHDLEPLEYGWMTRDNSRNFGDIARYTDGYAEGAQRYDMGQRAHLQLLPMALVALRQIVEEWTPQRIYQTLSRRNEVLAAKMREIGLSVAESENRGGHILGIHFDSKRISGEDILSQMKQHQFYVSIRSESIRISPHLFCTKDEYEQLATVFQQTLTSKM